MQLPKGTKLDKFTCAYLWSIRYATKKKDAVCPEVLQDAVDVYGCFLVDNYSMCTRRDMFISAFHWISESVMKIFNLLPIDKQTDIFRELITEKINPFSWRNNISLDGDRINNNQKYNHHLISTLLYLFSYLQMREKNEENGEYEDLCEYELSFEDFCEKVDKNIPLFIKYCLR